MLRIGQRLQNERIKKGLSIEDVAKATKIRASFLQALEKGDYKHLPSSAYIQGFIKIYAEFLNLPIKETMALFRREFNEREFLDVLPESFTTSPQPLHGFRLGQTTIFIALALLFICGFIFYQYRAAFFDPQLSVINPKENAVISSPIVTVAGQTEQNTTTTIDDTPVFIDKNGSFSKDVPLLAGSNTITVKTVNNFGRKSTIIRHVLVK